MNKKRTKLLYAHVYASNDGVGMFPIKTNIKLSKLPAVIDVREFCFASIVIVKGKKVKEPKIEDYEY